jgi:hypothetical protein
VRVTDNVITKVSQEPDHTTEYSTLKYLRDHGPNILAPRPCELIKLGRYYLIFNSYIPGQDLDQVWPQLRSLEKRDIH